MKKLDLGQTLGLLANAGVLAGIMLLAYELNQNRQMMRAQTRNAIAETVVNMLTLQANSPELSQIQLKRSAGQQLTPLEQSQFMVMEWAYWRFRENVNYQYRHGLFDESEYLAQRQIWILEVNTEEDAREVYCSRRSSTSVEFTSEIDAFMETPCD